MVLLNCLEVGGTWHKIENYLFQHMAVRFQKPPKAAHFVYIHVIYKMSKGNMLPLKNFTSKILLGLIRLDSHNWGTSIPNGS